MPFPSIDPIAFQFGPFAIRWYGIAYVVGILGWWKYSLWLLKKRPQAFPKVTAQLIDDYVGWAIGGVIIGGRLGWVLFYQPAKYLADPLQIFQVWKGGMAFHGGLLGVAIATLLYAHRHHIRALSFMDLVCCGIPIGLFFGRIANFINGELYGRVTDVSWGVLFPHGGWLPRHPSQLYEACLEGLLLFVVLGVSALWTRAPDRRGCMTGLFLAGYGLARIAAECFREPDAFLGTFVGGVTMGQLLSIPLVLVGSFLIIRASRGTSVAVRKWDAFTK